MSFPASHEFLAVVAPAFGPACRPVSDETAQIALRKIVISSIRLGGSSILKQGWVVYQPASVLCAVCKRGDFGFGFSLRVTRQAVVFSPQLNSLARAPQASYLADFDART